MPIVRLMQSRDAYYIEIQKKEGLSGWFTVILADIFKKDKKDISFKININIFKKKIIPTASESHVSLKSNP